MNPSSSEQSPLNLPAPVGENVSPEFAPSAGAPAGLPEMAPARPEQALNPGAGMPLGNQSAVPLPTVTLPPSLQQVPPTNDVSTTTHINVTSVADDGGVNEKAWVAKAKQIVERTKDDPSQQSKELTIFKADYLEKRYNKVIKVNE